MDASVISENSLYIDSAKAVKIYELIADKKINFQDIKDSDVEKQEFNKLTNEEIIKYVKEIDNKKYKTADATDPINTLTKAIKSYIRALIFEISEELEKYKQAKTMKNFFKLSCYYYLFKINTAKDVNTEKNYADKIDIMIANILSNI